jgi:hypothetical protein
MNANEGSEEHLGCCACGDELTPFSGGGCADKKNVFTRREQDVLARIREASLRAREIKEGIRNSSGKESSAVLLEESRGELERLRRLRDELETERIAAAEERMRMLGHL